MNKKGGSGNQKLNPATVGGNSNRIVVPTFNQSENAVGPLGNYTNHSANLNSLHNQTLANAMGDSSALKGGTSKYNKDGLNNIDGFRNWYDSYPTGSFGSNMTGTL